MWCMDKMQFLSSNIVTSGLMDRIEHLGTVSSIIRDSGGCTLIISNSGPILEDCHIGDSIAVNGACLTVTEFDKEDKGGWFKVWLANETLERTDLGERKEGEEVNLERAMGAKTRFGGHFVQAHVDGTGTILSKTADGDSLRISFKVGKELEAYIIAKGYVTIDGASLTVTKVDEEEKIFEVMLIQHTQTKITLGRKDIGSKVNIEVDMIGKYVAKALKHQPSPSKQQQQPLRPKAKINSISRPSRPASPAIPRRKSNVSLQSDSVATVRIKSKVTNLVARTSPPPPQRNNFQPLPLPSSPPTSTISYSSRSSVSVSDDHRKDDQLHSSISNLLLYSDSASPVDDYESDHSEQNLKAEAISNRKIADLEITNRSLLAINTSLESTKHKQAKEIRDLRRKLRESRLILPPRAFRSITDADDDASRSDSLDDDDDDEEEEEEEEAKDETYSRIKDILDNLLQSAKTALERQPADFVEPGKGGAKVLSADEVASWRREGEDEEDDIHDLGVDPINVAVPEDDDAFESEDEVERTLRTTPSPPPIRLTS
ncbi:hypothetical protein H0H93_011430 [Arthromyces matolae]|nr:hypothetical protein H0H93_011430 [Arthromyces matolae]